jgi:hypothetical protein
MADPNIKWNNVYQLVKECDENEWIDLDTSRKNKTTTMDRKKPKYSSPRNRVFSNSKADITSYVKFVETMRLNGQLKSTNSKKQKTSKSKQQKTSESKEQKTSKSTVKAKRKQSTSVGKSKKEKNKNRRLTLFGRKKKEKESINSAVASIGTRLSQLNISDNDSCERKNGQIPLRTRYAVWRKWNNGSMDGRCFCCYAFLQIESWHCGHIKARKYDGSIEPTNLRPTCKKCNLGMSTMNMYTYMFYHRLPGLEQLNSQNPDVILSRKEAETMKITEDRLENLISQNKVSRNEAKKLLQKVTSKRVSRIERIEGMEKIKRLMDLP